MRKLLLALALAFSLAAPATASAYLHVANAQSYAASHQWVHWCNYYTNCYSMPVPTNWYQRIDSSHVKVEIKTYSRSYGVCYRELWVQGSDESPSIYNGGYCTTSSN
jgi:ABC-type sugar transport system substrate-binding protein